MKLSYKALLPKIKTFVFDVDGVLTNGLVLLTEDDMLRQMSVRDGLAMKMAIDRNYRILIITGGKSPAVKVRLERLGVTDVYINSSKKSEVLRSFMDKYALTKEEMLYMGDDLPDWQAMHMCGIKTCPADAAEEIKTAADYVSNKEGGRGCVRDVIEQTLKVQGRWFDPKIEEG